MRDNSSRPRRTTHSKTSKPSRPSSRRTATASKQVSSARAESRGGRSGGNGSRGTGIRGASRPSTRSDGPKSTSRPRRDSDSPTRTRSERPHKRTGSARPRREESSRAGRSDTTRSTQRRDSRSTRNEKTERRSDGRSNARSSQTNDRRTGPSRPRRDDAGRPSSRRDARPTSRGRTERDGRSSPRRFDEKRTRSTARPERKFEPPKPTLTIPQDIDLSVVPKSVLAEIRLIAPHTQDLVKQYLAVAIAAIESAEFDRAYDYAKEARSLASRLATVREIAGLSAYYAGKWAEALSEFKTYMRMTGDPHFLPIMADCERGLNRPERAIALSKSRNVQDLDAAGKIEMRIVVSGARRDLRQLDNALAILEIPELRSGRRTIEVARLRYAYAEVLLLMGRKIEARDWFVKASLADVDEETDASERALKLGEIS